eukprot:s968_g7.t1
MVFLKDLHILGPCTAFQDLLLNALEASEAGALRESPGTLQSCALLRPTVSLRGLRNAWLLVQQRCTALRSRFIRVRGRHFQVALRANWSKEDLRVTQSWSGSLKRQLRALMKEDLKQPFHPTGALCRLHLLRAKEESSDKLALLLSIHNSVSDGWSTNLLLQDLLSLAVGIAAPLQRPGQALDNLHLEVDRTSWWRRTLEGFRPSALQRQVHLHSFDRRRLAVRWEALRQRAKAWQLTPAALVLAAWSLVWSRATGSKDFLLGAVLSGREAVPSDLLGCTASLVPLRLRVTDSWQSLQSFATEVQRCLIAHASMWPCPSLTELQAIMHMSGRSDSPFKTVIHSNSLGFSGDASASNRGPAPVLPPTAGPSGPFATHNSSFNTALGPFASQNSQASHNQTSFRTLIDEPAPGVLRMNSQGPQIPPSAHQGGPFSSFHSQGSAGFAQQSMPPRGPMMGPMGAMISQDGPPQGPPPVDSDLGVHCTVVVSKLLDVPVESGMFVKDAKTYQLRVMDHKRKELARSEEIQGLEDSQLHGLTTQTFSIPEELGTLHAKTLSKTIQVEVEFTGIMGATIGTCQINRLDFRSSKPWPYEVTSDNKVVCGIELCVVEDEPMVTSPMLYSSGMGMMQLHQVMSDKDVEDVQHNLSCKELRKIGLFQSDVRSGNQLASVDFKETRAFVRDRMYWGGDAQDGAQYIKIAISYGKRSGNATSTEIIGITDPIKVSWKEEKEYIKLWNPDNRRLLGGIYLSYRLVTEAEAVADGTMKSGRVALPQITAPVELERRVSGRTGNFAPGSAEEAGSKHVDVTQE